MSEVVQLKDIADLTVGYVGNMKNEYRSTGVPFLRSLNISPFSIDTNDLLYISEEFNSKIKKSELHTDDIVVVRTGNPGTCAVIPEKYDGANCSDLVIIHPDKKIVNPYYLEAYINFMTQGQISNLKVGAIQKHFNVGSAKEMKVVLPNMKEQEKIANVAKKINKKINNNTYISSKLESIAKTIYDYWFLQFDFPDKNGRPYKSSGGKMVWNEELKREIPEGWSITELGKTIEIKQPRIATNEIGGRPYVPIESLPRRRMSFSDTANLDKASTGLCTFDEKAILLSNRRVYFHKVCISPFNGVTRDTVIIIYPCIKSQLPYIYETLNTDHFISYATRYSYGSEQPVLSPEAVKHYQIELPPERIINLYSEKISSLIDNVLDLQKENRQLSSLRDFLLPMLMNGQVTFKDQA